MKDRESTYAHGGLLRRDGEISLTAKTKILFHWTEVQYEREKLHKRVTDAERETRLLEARIQQIEEVARTGLSMYRDGATATALSLLFTDILTHAKR